MCVFRRPPWAACCSIWRSSLRVDRTAVWTTHETLPGSCWFWPARVAACCPTSEWQRWATCGPSSTGDILHERSASSAECCCQNLTKKLITRGRTSDIDDTMCVGKHGMNDDNSKHATGVVATLRQKYITYCSVLVHSKVIFTFKNSMIID